ncbi:MAG: 2-(1,2-epoxy-1,2-dihydrophenyl)acetyl-CoA isomerase [Candidatus Lokiarchaeota archaeon]|nr:2-(1,2-epoxy-1,2-dihydrophenyl)acetyl-CoA isomerase [Candidatus Lokiarchaeota archaeon]
MSNKNLNVEIYEAKFAIIRFINTKKLNPLNRETALELETALDDLKDDDKVRSIIITGSGRAFSAGGDIKGMLKSIEDGNPDEFMDELTEPIYNLTYKLRSYPKPIIAAVNGYAIGAGMNLALSCDIVVASEKAEFRESFNKLGLIPGAAGTFLLINQIPWQKAAEYCFLGDKISPLELFNLGLVNLVVPKEELENIAIQMAEKLAKGPTLAYARTKKLFLEAKKNSFKDHIEIERQVQIKSALTEDYKIGVKAINERKKAQFTGK